jgi:hypothetical protein
VTAPFAHVFLAASCSLAGCAVSRWHRLQRTEKTPQGGPISGWALTELRNGVELSAWGALAHELRRAASHCRACSSTLKCEAVAIPSEVSP